MAGTWNVRSCGGRYFITWNMQTLPGMNPGPGVVPDRLAAPEITLPNCKSRAIFASKENGSARGACESQGERLAKLKIVWAVSCIRTVESPCEAGAVVSEPANR